VWKKEIFVYFLYFCIFANVGKLKIISENNKFEHHRHIMGYVCANFRISTSVGF